MSKNVSWDRVTDLKKTARQVCELLRKEKPIPKDLLDSLESLSHRKRKPEDPRLLEMFAAGAKVADIAAAVGKTTATVYNHRREWLKKNPMYAVKPVAEGKPTITLSNAAFDPQIDTSVLRIVDDTQNEPEEMPGDSVPQATDEAVSPVTEIEAEDDSRYLEISLLAESGESNE